MEQDNSINQKNRINIWWYLAPALFIVVILVFYFTVIRTNEVRGVDFMCGNQKCIDPNTGYIYYIAHGERVDCNIDQSKNYGGLICYDGNKIYDTLGIRIHAFVEQGDWECSYTSCVTED